MKKLIIVACTLAFAGCSHVTKEQLAKVEAKADNAVLQSIDATKMSAKALEAAKVAQATADVAANCCSEQKSRLDSMFEKAMRK